MKKKIFLACLSLLIVGSVFTTQAVTTSVNQQTESEVPGDDDGGGGGNDGDCLPPDTNICMKIKVGGVVIKTIKGVLTIVVS